MTLRGILLGLLGAAVVCGYTYFNDAVLHQSFFVGNHMPISVYGGLLLFLLIVNPLLRFLSAKIPWTGRILGPLSAKELVLAMAMTLAASCVPYSSLLRILPRVLMMPHHFVRTDPGWKWRETDGTESTVLDVVPKQMLCDISRNPNEALEGFIQGLDQQGGHIGIGDVPWYAWTRALGFWLPLTVVLFIALVGLSLVVHRQWARHEHLPYPIVAFTKSLLPDDSGISGIFRNRLFWMSALALVVYHLNNYAYVWFPQYLIPIPRSLNFVRLTPLFQALVDGGGRDLLRGRLYFSAIAIAYLLAGDVSFTVGIGPYIFCYIAGILNRYGISVGSGTRFAPRIDRAIIWGGYVSMFLSLIYAGRHYYWHLFRRSIFLPTEEKTDETAAWGLRVFIVCTVVFIIDLCLLGLDWQLATAYTILTLIIFLVMGRIIAETGLFFIAPYLYPCAFISGILGARMLGPQVMMIMFLLTSVFLIDPRECLMPFMVNSLKLADDAGLKMGRTAILCIVAILVGLAIAVPLTLYLHYDQGVNWTDVFGTRMVPKFAAEETIRVRQRLMAQGRLEDAVSVRGWQRLSDVAPDTPSMIAFAAGLMGVFVLIALRRRLSWWPLHPVMFLIWSGWAGRQLAFSFLIGCLVKMAISKYGGSSTYQKFKPLMFGLIAGDMLAGVIIIIVGLVYYLITGEIPKGFRIMPG